MKPNPRLCRICRHAQASYAHGLCRLCHNANNRRYRREKRFEAGAYGEGRKPSRTNPENSNAVLLMTDVIPCPRCGEPVKRRNLNYHRRHEC